MNSTTPTLKTPINLSHNNTLKIINWEKNIQVPVEWIVSEWSWNSIREYNYNTQTLYFSITPLFILWQCSNCWWRCLFVMETSSRARENLRNWFLFGFDDKSPETTILLFLWEECNMIYRLLIWQICLYFTLNWTIWHDGQHQKLHLLKRYGLGVRYVPEKALLQCMSIHFSNKMH